MYESAKIFSGTATRYLAEKIASYSGERLGEVSVSRFSDGEFQPSFEETVRGELVFIVQSTFPPSDNLFERLMMVDAAKRASAKRIVAVMPYFGFARQDRKDEPRVSIGAKLVANFPIGPIFDGGGLNMTVMSYQESLDFGLLACPDLIDDVWHLADGLRDTLDELVKAADEATGAVKPKTTGRKPARAKAKST